MTKTIRTPLEIKLSAIAKLGNINSEILLGEASYNRAITHPVIIRNEGSCTSVQVGSTSYGEYDIDNAVLKQAQALLDTLERQEEGGDFDNLEELSFIILESGVYRLYLAASTYTAYTDFIDLSEFDMRLKTKLYEDCAA